MNKLLQTLILSYFLAALFGMLPFTLLGQGHESPESPQQDSSSVSEELPNEADTTAIPVAKSKIQLSELVFSGRDVISISFSENHSVDTDSVKLLEYVQKVTDAAKSLSKEGNIPVELEIRAFLDQKKLKKEKMDGYSDAVIVKFRLDDGNEEEMTIAKIENEWELELLKLAALKAEIVRSGLFLEDQVSIIVISKGKDRYSQLDFKYKVGPSPLLPSKMVCTRTLFDLRQAGWLDTMFSDMTFDEIERLNTAYNSDEKKLVVSYANYETSYLVSADIEKLVSSINLVIERLRNCGINALHLTFSSYESAEFFTFTSEHTYHGEFDNPLILTYLRNQEEPEQMRTIENGRITILDQELLKLYGIRARLNLDEVPTRYFVNSDCEEEHIITQIIIYHD